MGGLVEKPREAEVTEWVVGLVSDLGYLALAFLSFLENVFPPIPSELIMPLGGFLVSQGELAWAGVVLAGTAGSLAGGLVLFFVGRLFSREQLSDWAERRGPWRLLTPDDVDKAFGWFNRHGKKAVFLARLVPGVRSLISIPAGACGMDLFSFVLYTTLGTALWSALLASAGMVLGNQYERLGQLLQWATYGVVALLVLVTVWWAVRRRRQRGGAG